MEVVLELLDSFYFVIGHGVGPYIGLKEIGNPSPMMNFSTINYLFYFIFGFIR